MTSSFIFDPLTLRHMFARKTLPPDAEQWIRFNGGRDALLATLQRIAFTLYRDVDYANILRSLIRDPHLSVKQRCQILDLSIATYKRKLPHIWEPIIDYFARHALISSRPPLALDPMVGREQDGRLLDTLVSRTRCTILMGPSGIGKTRLITDMAHRWVYPVFYCDVLDCQSHHDLVQFVFRILAQSLSPRHRRDSTLYYEGLIIDMLDERVFIDQAPLLILDHTDQIDDHDLATFVQTLIARTHINCLIVRQQRLYTIADARTMILPALAPHETLALIDRERDRLQISIDPDDDLSLLVDLAGGNPRAIRIMVRELVYGSIRELHDRIAIASYGNKIFSVLFHVSFQRLSCDIQMLLQVLSVLESPFTLTDLQDIAHWSMSERRLHCLIDAGFIRYDSSQRQYLMSTPLIKYWVREQWKLQHPTEYQDTMYFMALYWYRRTRKILKAWSDDCRTVQRTTNLLLTPLRIFDQYRIYETSITYLLRWLIPYDRHTAFRWLKGLLQIWQLLNRPILPFIQQFLACYPVLTDAEQFHFFLWL